MGLSRCWYPVCRIHRVWLCDMKVTELCLWTSAGKWHGFTLFLTAPLTPHCPFTPPAHHGPFITTVPWLALFVFFPFFAFPPPPSQHGWPFWWPSSRFQCPCIWKHLQCHHWSRRRRSRTGCLAAACSLASQHRTSRQLTEAGQPRAMCFAGRSVWWKPAPDPQRPNDPPAVAAPEPDKKKSKMVDFMEGQAPPDIICLCPSPYTIQRLYSYNFVELWYFTQAGCKDAAVTHHTNADDVFSITNSNNILTLHPVASVKASKNTIIDKDLLFSVATTTSVVICNQPGAMTSIPAPSWATFTAKTQPPLRNCTLPPHPPSAPTQGAVPLPMWNWHAQFASDITLTRSTSATTHYSGMGVTSLCLALHWGPTLWQTWHNPQAWMFRLRKQWTWCSALPTCAKKTSC